MTRTAVAGAYDGDDHLAALLDLAKARKELEDKEYFHVMQARLAGMSWANIAIVLGVSKQAVHRRFKGRMKEAGMV